MHCTNCGVILQPGVTACQNCGVPVSQNPAQQSSPSYDPTAVASPYNPSQTPQTGYGANSYGAGQSSGTQYDPYGSVPASQNPYMNNGYGQPVPPPPGNAYGQPVPPPLGNGYGQPVPLPNYGYPQGQPQGGYVPGMPGSYGPMPAQPPKKRGRVGLIIGIVVGSLLLLCVGLGVLFAVIGSQASKTTNSGTKSTSQSGTPSGKNIDPAAAAILHNPKTSTDVDDKYNPKNVTSTFTTSQSVYISFDIDSGDKDGYIQAKWYADDQLVDTRSFSHKHTNNVGLFSHEYTSPTTNGNVELYWCIKSDCSDAQLAQVVHFTVTSASLVPTSPTIATIQGAYRKVA